MQKKCIEVIYIYISLYILRDFHVLPIFCTVFLLSNCNFHLFVLSFIFISIFLSFLTEIPVFRTVFSLLNQNSHLLYCSVLFSLETVISIFCTILFPLFTRSYVQHILKGEHQLSSSLQKTRNVERKASLATLSIALAILLFDFFSIFHFLLFVREPDVKRCEQQHGMKRLSIKLGCLSVHLSIEHILKHSCAASPPGVLTKATNW